MPHVHDKKAPGKVRAPGLDDTKIKMGSDLYEFIRVDSKLV